MTYLQTGQHHDGRSQFIRRNDSRSKHWMCLQSEPRTGSRMRCRVIGHLRSTRIAVCSTPSSAELRRPPPPGPPPGMLFKCDELQLNRRLTGTRKNRKIYLLNISCGIFIIFGIESAGVLLRRQCSDGRSLLRISPLTTDLTLGR